MSGTRAQPVDDALDALLEDERAALINQLRERAQATADDFGPAEH